MGGSQSREPDKTVNERNIDIYIPYLTKVYEAPTSKETCDTACIKYEPIFNYKTIPGRPGLRWGGFSIPAVPPQVIKEFVRNNCVSSKTTCSTTPSFEPSITAGILKESYKILTVVPAFDREAKAITNYKLFLINWLENAVPWKKISHVGAPIDPQVVSLIDKLVDMKFDELRKKGFETDFTIQAEAISYYQRVWLGIPSLIDKKYVGLVSSLNKSMIYHTLPPELQKIPGAKINGSIDLFNIVYGFLESKILQQFQRKRIIKPILDEAELIFFYNTCAKVIDDKELNKYPNGDQIKGIDFESFTDADLLNDRIFEDLDSLKGCCKLYLFLYRKKSCSKYMNKDTKDPPDINTYRKCKIAGLEPLLKPASEVKRLADNEQSKKDGESSAISDENRALIEQKARKKEEADAEEQRKKDEGFSNNLKENFQNEVFNQVESNLKLVLGYVLIVIIIGIIIVLSPTILNFAYYIIADLLIPLIVYILTIIGQIVTILGKSALLTGEGLTMFVLGTLSSIIGMLQITTGLTSNFIKDIIVSLGQSLGIVGSLSTDIATNTVFATGTTAATFSKVGQDATINSFNSLGTTLGTLSKVGQDATIGSFNSLGTTIGTLSKVGKDVAVGSFNGIGTTIGTLSKVGQDATSGSLNILGTTIGSIGKVGQDATHGTLNTVGTTIGTFGKIGKDATFGSFNSLGTTIGTFGKIGQDGTKESFNAIGSTIGTFSKTGVYGALNLYSGITTSVGILSKIGYDGIIGGLLYLVDQFTNMVKISAGSGFSIVDIVINFFSLIVKIIMNTCQSVAVLGNDFMMLLIFLVVKGPMLLLSFFGKTIFENSKKFYMTINNIEE